MARRRSPLALAAWLTCGALAGAGSSSGCGRPPAGDAGAPDAGGDAPGDLADAPFAGPDAPPDDAAPACVRLEGAALVELARATEAGEHGLVLPAIAGAPTSWGRRGDEAVVLEVHGEARFIGHLVLHQGADGLAYGMHLGTLAAGEAVRARISPLSTVAAPAAPSACVGPATLRASAGLLADGEGLRHAPILVWPASKRFDDLPVVLGWSRATRAYQLLATNENGGTVAQCGGGAEGIEAEIARWGRAFDVERVYRYGASDDERRWLRCTGETSFASHRPRAEGDHPILYYGDGHNRLFESRGGYGQACGSGGAEQADGDLAGWNVANPGNEAAHDPPFTITLRPLPVELDPLGYAEAPGRREALADVHAPWVYRLTALELAREGKIDGARSLGLERYLYVDVQAADVDGGGDRVCSFSVSRGFVLRARTADGAIHDGPQMTADYFGGSPAWKRLAIPLDRARDAADVAALVFDAYDDDGIYLLSLGDAFVARPAGDNGAVLLPAHAGVTPCDVYVDDDTSGCSGGFNTDGPVAGHPYPCVADAFALDL